MIWQNPKAPSVLVKLIKKNNQWKVLKCPYCGNCHFHGAGEKSENPDEYLSHRVSHCFDDDHMGYNLRKSPETHWDLITLYGWWWGLYDEEK